MAGGLGKGVGVQQRIFEGPWSGAGAIRAGESRTEGAK
jgi:hypothetical protein